MIALREAKDLANRRVRFFGHVIVWAMVVFFLMITAGFFPAMVVACAWGIGLAAQGYYALVAPELRRRWTEQEYRWHMDHTVTAQRRSLQGKHSKSLEQLSASIAHEIRNPITAAKSLVQQMGEDPTCEENIEYARVAIEELDRVEKSISHLLRYAREENSSIERVDMVDVIESAVETFRDRIERTGVQIDKTLDPGTVIKGDAEQLRRVIINLVGNAIDALEQHPAGRVEIASGHNLAGTELWVRVKDNGMGIPSDRIDRIFDPFHTSKDSGTGLGLAITRKVVEAHAGSIEVNSQEGEGTTFELTFPAVKEGTA
ncbi:MAG: HAMP domain-containing sensor histidine kinase [Deltaproteobacteria bacterium]|jgi:signal transduction histidine kinase